MVIFQRSRKARWWLFALLCAAAAGCLPQPDIVISTVVPTTQQPTLSPSPSSTPFPPATLTPTPQLPTATPSITPFPEPAGCLQPPDDYSTLEVNGWTMNRRTFAMLEHAAELYGGEIDVTGWAITQGSFHDNGAASFGTHLGGGAVDLSVMRTNTWTVLYDDIEPLIHALRIAGFAAWLRDPDELYPGSPIHIHAIAIGDRELSQPAIDQLTGKFGYFRGYTGIPIVSGTPAPDRHGGPILCNWMRASGYRDLRLTAVPADE
jgi:hypothetical protein